MSIYAFSSDETVKIVSYNVENLFHPEHDSLKLDQDFTPNGNYHWTYGRYHNKLEKISRVIVNIGGWGAPILVGLCEVENAQCLTDLCKHLYPYPYKYIHYESPDQRGIDVGLLYDSLHFFPIEQAPIRLSLDTGYHTRDILYVKGKYNQTDTLHLFLCHLPSQIGGYQALQRREKALSILQEHADSILAHNQWAQIVIMGDFNDPRTQLLGGLDMPIETSDNEIRSHKHKGIWSQLDQCYVSPALNSRVQAHNYAPQWLLEYDKVYLGEKPKRTYNGFRYNPNGFSDHLPICISIHCH